MASDRGNVIKTVVLYLFQRSTDQFQRGKEHVQNKLKRRVSSVGVFR